MAPLHYTDLSKDLTLLNPLSEKPKQAILLNFDPKTAQDFIRACVNKEAASISLGKRALLRYGTASKEISTTKTSKRLEIYQTATDNSQQVSLHAVVARDVEPKSSESVPSTPDPALLQLELSLQAKKHERDARSAKVSIMEPVNNPMRQRHQARSTASRSALSKLNGTFGGTGRNSATPSGSPGILAKRALENRPNDSLSGFVPPRSNSFGANPKVERMQAIRYPLIHFVAAEPASTKFLVNKIKGSIEDCKEILSKVAKTSRDDSTKWELTDKTYKELDIWTFPYASDGERQQAVDHAVSAFDRMRIGPKEKQWQILLPKEKRNQGICLSRLKIGNGQASSATTPQIKVQHAPSEDISVGSGNSTPNIRSAPQDPSARKRQEARLLGKNKRPAAAAKPKAPRAKPTEKKAPIAGKTTGKVKSAEYIKNSDDEAGMVNESSVGNNVHESLQPKNKGGKEKTAKSAPKAVPKAAPKRNTKQVGKTHPNPPAVKPSSREMNGSTSESVQRMKNVSRQKITTSPQKPSPLGSSPPTNASDIEDQGPNFKISSTKASPAIPQKRPATIRTVKVSERQKNSSAPLSLKRKAEATEVTKPSENNKRHRLSPVPPKSKSNTLPNHSQSATTTPRHPQKRKISDINTAKANSDYATNKRHQSKSVTSPPASAKTATTSSGSDSPPDEDRIMEEARNFERYYKNYFELHHKVSTANSPLPADLARLKSMHERLSAMKKEIHRGSKYIHG
ncbi:MAG: hypothetical protein M1834_007653 [Cirrosporium novae-zelandiae]|nr:MAG: hypothetical protein M1834_007653 [Cirrosporium novae-zelandiae]